MLVNAVIMTQFSSYYTLKQYVLPIHNYYSVILSHQTLARVIA